MGDVRAEEEAVGVGLGEDIGAIGRWAGSAGGVGGARAERFDNAGDSAGEEVAACTLAEEGADFFVVEKGGEGDDAAVGLGGGGVCFWRRRGGGGDEGFDGGKRAYFIVNAAGEDEFLIKTAELRGLGVEDFEVPVYDALICVALSLAFPASRLPWEGLKGMEKQRRIS